MASYLEFLRYLAQLGPKIPAAIEIIDRIIVEVQKLTELFGVGFSAPRETITPETTAEIAQLEAQVMANYNEATAGTEGLSGPLSDRLKAVLQFVRENPELLQFLLLFLK